MSNYTTLVTQGKPQTIREVKGRNSKYSSEVYCYRLEDLQAEPEDELDEFFGITDAVRRRREYLALK